MDFCGGFEIVGVGAGLAALELGPAGAAAGVACFIKKTIDDAGKEAFTDVKQREFCNHITMLEDSTIGSIVKYVAVNGGVTWCFGRTNFFSTTKMNPFYH